VSIRRASQIVVSDREAATAVLVRQVAPKASLKLVRRCLKAGLDEERGLKRALALIAVHRTSLPAILEWLENGITLERLETCLAIRRQYHVRDSVRLIDRCVEAIGFHERHLTGVNPNLLEVFETFQDVLSKLGGMFPAHRLLHRIDEAFNGDILAAYRMALDDEAGFVQVVKGRRDTMSVFVANSPAFEHDYD